MQVDEDDSDAEEIKRLINYDDDEEQGEDEMSDDEEDGEEELDEDSSESEEEVKNKKKRTLKDRLKEEEAIRE